MKNRKTTGLAVLAVAGLFALPLFSFIGTQPVDTSATSVMLNASVEPYLEVNIPTSALELVLQPSAGKPAFNYGDIEISASTNHATGYTLSMLSTSTDLYGGKSQYDYTRHLTIPTFTDGQHDEESFPVNSWGYKLSGDLYSPFETKVDLKTTDGPTTDTTNVTFGVKVDETQPQGTYSIQIDFVAVTNAVGDYGPATMQDYDVATCATEAASVEAQVEDARDGNVYTVRYIDGNCWMTQNLAYDPSMIYSTGLVVFDPETSNVKEVTSYDILDSVTSSFEAPYLHVPTEEERGDLTASEAGVFYNYCAATAGEICEDYPDNYQDNKDATQDICPAGWRLPTGNEISNIQYDNQDLYNFAYAGMFSFNNGDNGELRRGSDDMWSSDSAGYSFEMNNGGASVGMAMRDDMKTIRCVRSN